MRVVYITMENQLDHCDHVWGNVRRRVKSSDGQKWIITIECMLCPEQRVTTEDIK